MASFTPMRIRYPVVVELRQLGQDVLTVQEAGQKRPERSVVLHLPAPRAEPFLPTTGRHFIRLHRQTSSHSGIVFALETRLRSSRGRIDQTVANCPNLTNQLLRVYRPSFLKDFFAG